MLVTEYKSILHFLRCPRTGLQLVDRGDLLESADGQFRYQKIGGQPVLIDFDSSIVDESAFLPSAPPMVVRAETLLKRMVRKHLFHGGADELAERNARQFLDLARTPPKRPLVLLIGGGGRGIGTDALYGSTDSDLLAFDVYPSRDTTFVADAHRIPLQSECVDAVWIQYVLEHVLEPWTVVAEIVRILKPGGIVYAETPFLQQVHEHPYDFVRFTHAGHRWLFRRFDEITSGVAMGQGAQVLWTVEHVSRGVLRSKMAGHLAKLALFPLQYLDRLIPKRYRMDSASSFFFLGAKQAGELLPRELMEYCRAARDQ